MLSAAARGTNPKQAAVANQQRLELESRLSKLAVMVPGILFTFRRRPDGSSCLPYLSPKIETMFGLQPELLVADSTLLFRLVVPDDLALVQEAIRLSAETMTSWNCIFRCSLPDGGILWVEGLATPEREPDGGILWHGFLLDVTERQQAELELRRHRQELEMIFDSLPAIIFYKDRNHRLVRISQEAVRVTGLQRDQIEGLTDQDMGRAYAEKYYRDDDEVMATGIAKKGIIEPVETLHGDRWMETEKIPYRDGHGRIVGVLGFSVDITDRRLAEAERLKLEAELRQSQKMEAVGQLAGGVAHDFNNILTVIHCNAALLQDASGPAPEQLAIIAQQIIDATNRAARLTGQLLLAGRQQALQSRDVNVAEIVAGMTAMLRPLLGAHITLTAECTPNLPPVWGDHGMIEQVILNLVVNSRDALPAGGRVRLSATAITFAAGQLPSHPEAASGTFVRLCVADNGSGIAPEVRSRIFEPFFTTKEPGKGSGLGLATVFGIVKQHGGWIDFESEIGVGTSFQVHLPVLARPGPSLPILPPPDGLQPGTETILLVEDEAPLRALAKTILQRCGYTVIEAASGPAALVQWDQRQAPIDLLLTDMVLPDGLTGRELAACLRAVHPGLKVILSSGYSPDLVATAELAENDAFLAKPFTPAKLAQAVRDRLDRV